MLIQKPFQYRCAVVVLKRDVIVGDLHRLWERTVRQGQISYCVKVQNIVSVHEHDLAALRRIELPPEPVPCRFRNFTTGYDEGVIHQDTAVCLGIENFMAEHHQRLLVDFCYVFVRSFAIARRVELTFFAWMPKYNVCLLAMSIHPNVFAVCCVSLAFIASRQPVIKTRRLNNLDRCSEDELIGEVLLPLAFARQGHVQDRHSFFAAGVCVLLVALIHERAYYTGEGVGRRGAACLWLLQNFD